MANIPLEEAGRKMTVTLLSFRAKDTSCSKTFIVTYVDGIPRFSANFERKNKRNKDKLSSQYDLPLLHKKDTFLLPE